MGNRRWVRWLPPFLQQKVSGRQGLQAILANSGWLIADKVIRAMLGFFIGAWIARYLGPTQYGELAYAMAYIAIFQAITSLGLDGIVVRDLTQNKEVANEILGTAFALKLCAGICCWLLAVISIAAFYNWTDTRVLIVTLVGGSLVFQAADTIDLWYQSQSASRKAILSKLIGYTISNGIKVILLINNASLYALAFTITLEAFLCSASLWLYYHTHRTSYFEEKLIAIKWQATHLLKESWPYMLSSLAIIIYMRVDQIIIESMLGSKALGIYAAVLPLSTTWQLIPMVLSTSITPFLAKLKKEDDTKYQIALKQLFWCFSLIGWLICIPMFLLAQILVPAFFGETYKEGIQILEIHIFTNIFIGMGIAQGLWAINESKSRIFFYKVMAGSIICVAGNLTLIPFFGLKAPAISAVLSQIVAAIVSNIVLAPHIFKLQIKSLCLIYK